MGTEEQRDSGYRGTEEQRNGGTVRTEERRNTGNSKYRATVGTEIWRAMTSLSGLSSNGQLRPSPSVLASRAAAELKKR